MKVRSQRCLAIFAILAVSIASLPALAGMSDGSEHIHWACSTPLLPDYKAKSNDPDVGEGVSYLYVGAKHLETDYGADALFTTPLDGRRGWYDSGVRLGPLRENNGFVQVEVSRWERFDYKPHIAIAWAVAHGKTVQYRDTGLMLAGGEPHRLGIYVRGGVVHLTADGRDVCSTTTSPFAAASERKYFQIRTETGVVGSNGDASVSNVRLKRDGDTEPRPYSTDCVLHRFGIFWSYLGARKFAARGAFYPNEALFFTGRTPGTPCRT